MGAPARQGDHKGSPLSSEKIFQLVPLAISCQVFKLSASSLHGDRLTIAPKSVPKSVPKKIRCHFILFIVELGLRREFSYVSSGFVSARLASSRA
jgi:hypothetical protein